MKDSKDESKRSLSTEKVDEPSTHESVGEFPRVEIHLHGAASVMRDASIPHGISYDTDLDLFSSRDEDEEQSSVGTSASEHLLEDTVFPVADVHGKLAHYPGEEEQPQQQQPTETINDNDERKEVNNRWSFLMSLIEVFKYSYSVALLIFSIILAMSAMFTNQTNGTANMGIHPAITFFVFWFLIVWLAMMEGGLGGLVGLQPVDKTLYAHSHPRSLKITTMAHKGDNMGRFIVGRQFLLVLVVFVTNLMASAVGNASVLGLPDLVNEIFLATGLAIILITIMIGQLTAQINSANCMLDFVNNYFMLFTTYISLFIEMTGLLHSVYLVQIVFAKITRTSIQSDEPPRSRLQKILFWLRVALSIAILGLAFAVTLTALFQGQTAMWIGVPEAVSIILFFVLVCFVGMMEGMQIAVFAVVNLPQEELASRKLARKTCELTFRGSNLQAFLIGRQICVTICMFVVARITTVNVETGQGQNIFGVSDSLQHFFNTGLLGAVITTIAASLAWRIIASSFPVAFLSNPLVYLIIRLCLLLEATGVCSAAWLLAFINRKIARYQLDEVYIGTPEERAAAAKKEDALVLQNEQV